MEPRVTPALASSHDSQMVEEQKALVLQKYARAWLVRRRFQTMRRLVLNVQLSYRVQQLRKKIEEKVDAVPKGDQLLYRGCSSTPLLCPHRTERTSV